MVNLIEENHEFCEIVNAFPALLDRLKYLYNVEEIKEGISLHDYFSNIGYGIDEISLIVKKLNIDVKYFLKNGSFPQTKAIKMGHEPISLEEE